MIKVSYILNSIALLLLVYCGWFFYSSHNASEILRQEIVAENSKLSDTKIAVDEAKKGQVDKLAREKRKNSELEEISSIANDQIIDLSRKRDEMKVELEENQKKADLISAEIQKNKVSLVGVAKEVEASQNALKQLTSNLPILQNSIFPLQNQIEEERKRKVMLEEEMLTYEQETRFLKNHYDLTVSSLQKDFYERPWLERGERVSVSYSDVDLSAGLLILPIGKDHGVEEKMRFSVRKQGEIICQIKIKKVEYDHCIAMIVPLLGNPAQLMELKKLDLIHL